MAKRLSQEEEPYRPVRAKLGREEPAPNRTGMPERSLIESVLKHQPDARDCPIRC